MSNQEKTSLVEEDPGIKLGNVGDALFLRLLAFGVVALGVAAFLGFRENDAGRRFMHSYLVSFAWVLSIGLGALWWVTLQHLVNAKWSIVIRRVGEVLAANMWILAVFALPIVVPAVLGNDTLFPWADSHHMHNNHALHGKAGYLNPGFFLIRCVIYFAFWVAWSQFLLKASRKQDSGKATNFVDRLRGLSAPSMIAFALTLTFSSIDLLMSLDPMWFSTMFGVYYFAGSVIAVHATFVIVLNWLQAKGRLNDTVTTEHFHDLGKMLFAFTVFWAYISFSQFMLIWYANVPEETTFFLARARGSWLLLSYALVFVHFALPFFGLLSRHVKRHRGGLLFWSGWLLLAHYADLYWLIMPNFDAARVPFGFIDIANWLGLGAVFLAVTLRRARTGHLIPTRDPRLASSMGFENA
jgi:hypothetical protein